MSNTNTTHHHSAMVAQTLMLPDGGDNLNILPKHSVGSGKIYEAFHIIILHDFDYLKQRFYFG